VVRNRIGTHFWFPRTTLNFWIETATLGFLMIPGRLTITPKVSLPSIGTLLSLVKIPEVGQTLAKREEPKDDCVEGSYLLD
jgi:hypothetical protein